MKATHLDRHPNQNSNISHGVQNSQSLFRLRAQEKTLYTDFRMERVKLACSRSNTFE